METQSYEDPGKLAKSLVERLSRAGMTIAVGESLTGGLLAATIVSVPGASVCFRGGAVTYATDTKASVLGVPRERLARTGPVDDVVALAMARGVAELFGADIGVSTTGVAGPGSADGKPAGTVYVGRYMAVTMVGAGADVTEDAAGKRAAGERLSAQAAAENVTLLRLTGGRQAIRRQTVAEALRLVTEDLTTIFEL